MTKLRFLTKQEIQTIAAGEVVERPASIIKELVENSIDAKATSINIKIKNSGKDFIEIEDNGFGIAKDDLEISILPHTTSKFTEILDLTTGKINTYGFRGEALASISAISKIKIDSKNKNESEAYQLSASFSENVLIEKSFKNNGTTITIENIFDSVPARKKFLKSKETEWNAIENILIGMGLSSPNIRFSIWHNEKSVYEWPIVDDIFLRAKHILPFYLHEYVINCDYMDENCKIKGVISSIEYGTYDRSNIFILINGRLIKQYKVTQAIIKAYQAELLSHRYPFAYLSIELNPEEVDINVHPRKEEVLFLYPKKIETSIFNAIKKSLNKESKNIFEPLSINKNEELEERLENNNFIENKKFSENYFKNEKETKSDFFIKNENNYNKNDFLKNFNNLNLEKVENNEIFQNINNFKEKETYVQRNLISDKENLSNNFLGIFSNTYLLFDMKEYLLFIDQHALHEKIIYESILKDESKDKFQELLNPIHFIKNEKEINFLKKNENLFIECGLLIDILEPSTVIIRAFSNYLNKVGIEESFNIIFEKIKENENSKNIKIDLLRKIKGDIACKRAIRAGDKLQHEEIALLIQNAFQYENIFLCPHGRPTFYKLFKNNIEKFFQRI